MNDEMRPELTVWFPVFRVTTASVGDQGPPEEMELSAAPQPEREASEYTTRSGGSLEIYTKLLVRCESHRSESAGCDVLHSVRRIL